MTKRIFTWFPIAATAACLLAATAWPEEPGAGAAGLSSLDQFARLAVLDSGRKMPMDSFARNKLLQFSGKSTYNRRPAIDWLTRVFFAPETTGDDKIFLINHPQVVQALDLLLEPRRRYSQRQLEPSTRKLRELARAVSHMESEDRSAVENEVLRVAHNLRAFMSLQDSFHFAAADPALQVRDPDLRERLGLSDDAAPSALEVFLAREGLRELMASAEVGEDGDLSSAAMETAQLSASLNRTISKSQHLPPAMVPFSVHGEETWLSPWAALSVPGHGQDLSPLVARLGEMAAAYRQGEQLEFDLAARTFGSAVREQARPDRQMKHLDLELRFNKLDLFYRCEMLYGLTFLVGFAALVTGRRGLRSAALVLLTLALILNTAGILLRMNIMGRPPVTNLYSTFLFVAWMSALLCAVLEAVQKNSLGAVAGGFSGLALLLLSRRFISMSDPLGVLVAVLDSNFWLATHVVTITMGYAGCCLAGLIGFFYLLQAIINPRQEMRLRSLYNALFAVLGFGLTFSFLGTMLGGVWADQSWGRFWGWDPKENGALLIVLWCAILYHARLSRMIGDVGMAAGSILGVIVVLFAWLGVNLLGVGLHSYGFTSGVATGLFAYAFGQVVLLAVLVPWARHRRASVPGGSGNGES